MSATVIEPGPATGRRRSCGSTATSRPASEGDLMAAYARAIDAGRQRR